MGILWFALIIPLLSAMVLLLFFRSRTKWWELCFPIAATIMAIGICQAIAINSATSDMEYWGHMGVKVVHEEPFSYDDTCTEQYPCGTDKDGNIQWCTRTYHCVQNSYRSCYLVNDKGSTYGIDYGEYQRLEKAWQMNKYGHEKIVTHSGGYTTIGDKYNRAGHGSRHWLWWNDDWRVGIPIAEQYTYENRLQAAGNTFHWRDVSEKEKKDYKLFDYPTVRNYTVSTILSQGPAFIPADQYLRYMNGWLNTTQAGYKKVRMWILVFVDQPEKAGEVQEMYWKNGNKNEFIVMFGINKEGELLWHRITSWTKKEAIKIEVRDEIALSMMTGKDGYSGKLESADMVKFAKFLGNKVQHGYVKPNFREYNYLSIEPSITGIVVSYSVVLLICIGVVIFVVKNPWCDEVYQRSVGSLIGYHPPRPRPTPNPRLILKKKRLRF